MIKVISATGKGANLRYPWIDTYDLQNTYIYFDNDHLWYPYVHTTNPLSELTTSNDSITYQLFMVQMYTPSI